MSCFMGKDNNWACNLEFFLKVKKALKVDRVYVQNWCLETLFTMFESFDIILTYLPSYFMERFGIFAQI